MADDKTGAALDRLLPFGLRQDMDRLMPSHFEAPAGSRRHFATP